MKVVEILQRNEFSVSFEFFPPKTAASSEALKHHIQQLLPLSPSFVSVTYGAGGTTQQLTKELVLQLQNESKLCIVSHLTCVGHSRDQLHQLLSEYRDAGIRNLMVLRGDPPKDSKEFIAPKDGFAYAADLLAYIKKHFPEFCCGVAGYPEGHPETPNRLQEMEYLKKKVDAGADYICTQLFFDNHAFYDFCERCEIAGIDLPILPGIMPVSSISGLKRMAELSGGSNFPAALLRSLQRADSEEGVRHAGIHWATEQVRDLIDHKVRGVHFYTLNQSQATIDIYKNLGIKNSASIKKPVFFSL